ncbi:MAG: CoA-binding protein [Terracidiphilus sp.]
MPDDSDLIDEMLLTAKTIAVLGMSDKPWRASNHIGQYLAANGYRVLPVNPKLNEISGQPCYPDLDAAQAAVLEKAIAGHTGKGIDLVDVFRAPEFVPAIVEDVIRLGIPYLWLQDEVIHDQAVARARAAGVKCVQNDCIFRRHAARPNLHQQRG